MSHWKVTVWSGASIWYFVTLSMPNSNTEPHGNVTASATPFSSTSRTSGALACTLVPPSRVTQAATVACDGPDLHSLDVARHDDLLGFGMEGQRIEDEGEAVFHVLHLVRGVFAVPVVDRPVAALGIADQERQLARGDDREAAGLVAGIDIGEVGDAVARHVVMVERLAELLRGIDLVLDGAVRSLLDRSAPVLHRLLQRMRRRHPVRQLQLEGLVLRCGRADTERQAENRQAAKLHPAHPVSSHPPAIIRARSGKPEIRFRGEHALCKKAVAFPTFASIAKAAICIAARPRRFRACTHRRGNTRLRVKRTLQLKNGTSVYDRTETWPD